LALCILFGLAWSWTVAISAPRCIGPAGECGGRQSALVSRAPHAGGPLLDPRADQGAEPARVVWASGVWHQRLFPPQGLAPGRGGGHPRHRRAVPDPRSAFPRLHTRAQPGHQPASPPHAHRHAGVDPGKSPTRGQPAPARSPICHHPSRSRQRDVDRYAAAPTAGMGESCCMRIAGLFRAAGAAQRPTSRHRRLRRPMARLRPGAGRQPARRA
jgi:hypothetical protein